MWTLDTIEWIDLELTSFCNIKCNGCLRENEIAVKDLLNDKVLSYDLIIEKIKYEDFPNIKIINFCGSIDEPCSHPDFFKIIDYFKKWDAHINVATNGSLKTTKWWTQLAEKLNGYHHSVTFAIDGLEDTHSIYRQGSSYNKVLNNAKAFMKAGGHANWQFIEFEHNKHQLDEAHDLSKKLGFKKFKIIRSTRQIYRSKNISNTKRLDVKESSRIECKYGKEKRIFINHLGMLIPCCHINGPTLKYMGSSVAQTDYQNLLEKCGSELAVSLKYNTFDEILHSDVWNGITSSWDTETPIKQCELKCKKNFRDEFEHRYN